MSFSEIKGTAARDEEFARLQEQFRPLLEKQISLFAEPGADPDSLSDWRQEALIGRFKAMEHYDQESGIPFAAYAKVCLSHRLISYRRHMEWMRMLRPLSEEEEDALPDDEAMAPESQAVAEAEEQWLWKRLEQVLTDFEVSCLRCHLEGYSYEESAVALRTDSKAVDNALQRARRKLRKRLGAQPDFFRFDR